MEIKQLKAFATVARQGSFSRAAELLDYAQSSISGQIQLLETDLGIRLFERLGRKVVLTGEGERLLVYAEQVLKLIDEARESVLHAALPKGPLRIGAPESLCISRLPPLLKEYNRRHPDVELILKLGGSSDFHRWLLDNSVDVAFFIDRQVVAETFISEALCDEPMVIAAGIDHPISERTSVGPADLRGESLILTESGNSYRAIMDRILAEANVQPKSTLESGSIEAIKKLVISGLGVTLLPRVVLEQELHAGLLTELQWQGPAFQIRTQVVRHKDKWLSPALQVLLSLAREMIPLVP